MTSTEIELLKNIHNQTNELATAMNTMAVTMARMEETHGFIVRQQQAQKEVDEAQNFKIANVQEDIHALDKRLIELKSMPDSMEKNWAVTRDMQGRIKELANRLDAISKAQDGMFTRLENLETLQSEDESNWKVTKGVGSWFANKLLGPLITFIIVAAAAGLGIYFK